MIDNKKFTIDWLQFIEQVKDRINRDKIDNFEYQLSTKLSTGRMVTLLIKVVAEEQENVVVLFPKKDEDIA